jgi:hypothetical protein
LTANKVEKRKSRRSASWPYVYRTTYLHEADLVANEFEERGIAFYRAQEGPPGVRWAMPLSAAWAPGTCFAVIVPGPHARHAAAIVKGLPVSNEEYPGVWQPSTSERLKRFWRGAVWLYLAVLAAALIEEIVSALRR